MVTEGAWMAPREPSGMAEIEGKGRGLVAQHDRRSLLGEVLLLFAATR
jgi:hypothetical protein